MSIELNLISVLRNMAKSQASSAVFAPNGTEVGKKYISLSVSYKKGGCNAWYGKQEKRGFELVVSSKTATESGFMVTPMDPENFRYFLGQEISRTSKKAEKLAFEDLLFRIDNDEQLKQLLANTEKSVLTASA